MKVAFLFNNRPDYAQRIPADLDWVQVYADADGTYPPEMLDKVSDVDALIGSIRDPVHDQLLDGCKNLKIVQRMGVGYDNVDTEAVAKRGIPVCNLADVNKDALGEHGIALMLAMARRLVDNHNFTAKADWAGARALCDDSFELQGKSLGILGFGKSGYELSRRAKVFGMNILFASRSMPDTRLMEAVEAEQLEIEDLFRQSDYLAVCVSLNDATRDLVDAKMLGLMKPSAYILNLARGGIIDEQALADALNSGKLAGAGMDAFSLEPITTDNPLLTAKNIVLTSHVAGTTKECTDREVGWAIANVQRFVVDGKAPRWIVNGVKV